MTLLGRRQLGGQGLCGAVAHLFEPVAEAVGRRRGGRRPSLVHGDGGALLRFGFDTRDLGAVTLGSGRQLGPQSLGLAFRHHLRLANGGGATFPLLGLDLGDLGPMPRVGRRQLVSQPLLRLRADPFELGRQRRGRLGAGRVLRLPHGDLTLNLRLRLQPCDLLPVTGVGGRQRRLQSLVRLAPHPLQLGSQSRVPGNVSHLCDSRRVFDRMNRRHGRDHLGFSRRRHRLGCVDQDLRATTCVLRFDFERASQIGGDLRGELRRVAPVAVVDRAPLATEERPGTAIVHRRGAKLRNRQGLQMGCVGQQPQVADDRVLVPWREESAEQHQVRDPMLDRRHGRILRPDHDDVGVISILEQTAHDVGLRPVRFDREHKSHSESSRTFRVRPTTSLSSNPRARAPRGSHLEHRFLAVAAQSRQRHRDGRLGRFDASLTFLSSHFHHASAGLRATA